MGAVIWMLSKRPLLHRPPWAFFIAAGGAKALDVRYSHQQFADLIPINGMFLNMIQVCGNDLALLICSRLSSASIACGLSSGAV